MGSIWRIFNHHCWCWWPAALAPGHQKLQCSVCIHAFPVVYGWYYFYETFWHILSWNSLYSLYPRPTKLEGGVYWILHPSVRPSVRPSVCRGHGFQSISQVCFGISLSNFICMLMVVKGRSLLIFKDITFKMAAWQPYWISWFPDFNFNLALNINFKLQWHNTYFYG